MKTGTAFGICQLCDERTPKAAMVRHLASCGPKHDSRRGSPGDLLYLRAEGKEAPIFWIDLEIKADSPLRRLDDLLRRVWLECCGHLSAFEIAGLRYPVVVDHEFGVDPNERSMNAKVSRVLAPGQRLTYEYDFGSTTYLTLRCLSTRRGIIGKPAARLVARNEPPVWPCAVCGDPATLVCPFCLYERDPFCCAKHAGEHECGEENSFLPVVNSPRMGVCGYTGEVEL
jgi:hypothetical protein